MFFVWKYRLKMKSWPMLKMFSVQKCWPMLKYLYCHSMNHFFFFTPNLSPRKSDFKSTIYNLIIIILLSANQVLLFLNAMAELTYLQTEYTCSLEKSNHSSTPWENYLPIVQMVYSTIYWTNRRGIKKK